MWYLEPEDDGGGGGRLLRGEEPEEEVGVARLLVDRQVAGVALHGPVRRQPKLGDITSFH